MTSIANNSAAKIAAVAVGMALAFAVAVAPAHAALTQSQVQSILSLLQSFGADQSTINNVNASLTGQPTTTTTTTTTTTMSSCTFTRDLTLGSKGDDVTCLQTALVAHGFLTMPSGVAMGYFGALTQSAVSKWQTSAGVSPAAGYFGAKSRAAFASVSGPTSTTPTPAPGTGLAVSACPTQPANSLAPQGATRVPFTCFQLTAGNDGAVTVNSVTVQRTGLGSNADFAGVILVDQSNNTQLGIQKTFNSNYQATVGTPVTIGAGQTKSFMIAGNMAASLSGHTGEAPSISLVAVNTSAAVSGSLPIVGATQTTNATLSVGTITIATSNAFAPNSEQTKNIGDTNIVTTGLRFTAGSAEDIKLMSMTFNQTGSASTVNDLANINVVVGGTKYPAVVSADGKYVMASLGSGVLIAKGNSVETYVSYDLVGSNASSRTVIFDVDKTTDIYAQGVTYGYGISPSASNTAVPSSRGTLTVTNGTPFVYSNTVTISGASVTTIAKDTGVAAQNIAINVPNQPLGGFKTDIKGESMTVQSLVFSVASTTGARALTNVTLVDENGAVVAGPVDSSYSSANTSTLTFTDSVTFKTGMHTFRLLGKVGSDSSNGGTYIISSTPSSQWTNVKGDVTGNSISLSSIGSFSMNTMTVKSGQLSLGLAASPANQSIVPGGSSVLMANVQFDASQSGEDIRFSQIPATLTYTGGGPGNLTSCAPFDGTTQLSTGSNVVNPSAQANTFTLDNPVTAAKGTVKTVGIRCNISASATSTATYAWAPKAASNFTFTGANSGQAISGTDATYNTVTVTIAAGSATVTTGAGSPSYVLAAAGATDVAALEIKLHATNESLNLTKLGLKLTNTASSSSGDLIKASIYDGATKVGEAFFAGSATTATSTLSQVVSVPKDGDKSLTVKLDLAAVGTGQPVTFSGHLVAVDYLNAEGTGADSGTTQLLGTAAGSTSAAGVRVMKSFPVIALDSLPSTGIADGRLMNFKVTADSHGPVSITNFAINVATTSFATGGGLSNITIYGFTDSGYSTPISGITASGDLQSTDDCTSGCASGTNIAIGVTDASGNATTIQVPAGQTRYFQVRSTVSGAQSGTSVTVKLLGNSAFPSTAAGVSTNPLLQAGSGSFTATTDMVWSPNSTTTPVRGDMDWTNGFGITGLPSGGLINTRSN